MQLRDLSIHVNGQQTFFLDEKLISAYSGKLRKIIKQEKRKKSQIIDNNLMIEIDDFPGGPDGFEMVLRFCYNNGRIEITVWNVCLLHCCASFLGMTDDKVSNCNNNNLLKQTEKFIEGMFYRSWNDIISALKSCQSLFTYADSSGLLQKLISALLAKIAQHSDSTSLLLLTSSSSSPSSPETPSGFRLSSSATPDSTRKSSGKQQWWFNDLALLPPEIIESFIKTLGAYGTDNNSLILTKFLIHYLKNRNPSKINLTSMVLYTGLAETVVHGVVSSGKPSFSCRGLLLILRTVQGFGVSKGSREKLEKLIGSKLDKATLDDLLICGEGKKGVCYDVKLVVRLVRTFVNDCNNNDESSSGSSERAAVSIQRMKKVGRLIDKYLGEISPDHNLKMSKFLGVAESLPDFSRDCFDGVYKAIDMYLQSHPTLTFEERSRLCRCINYEKLSLEACKDLAKSPRIPPSVAIEALKSQKCYIPQTEFVDYEKNMGGGEDIKMNIEKMQRRVFELEKACKEMRGQMSLLVRHNHVRALPRLC